MGQGGPGTQEKAGLTELLQGRAVAWAPQPGPQAFAISCPFNEILYGGAKGGGKSDFIVGDWLAHYARHPRYAAGIVFRESFPELEQLILRMKQVYPLIGARYNESRKIWFFPGGATLKLRFVDSLKSAKKYQGHEYTWMAFDECGNIPKPDVVNELRGALRNSRGIPSRLVLTGNPLGDGHEWLLARFILSAPAYTPIKETVKLPSGLVATWSRVFIPALLEDNPLLLESQPDYLIRLEQMTAGKPWLYRALRFGDWSVRPEAEGALWTIAGIDKHRVDPLALDALALSRHVVAVDPSGSGNPAADECGIVLMGAGDGPHKYLLEDASLRAKPSVWAAQAVKLYEKAEANAIAIETNFGGDMVRETIERILEGLAYDDREAVTIQIDEVHVSKGKRLRAEPVAAQADKGLIHHVGRFRALETEQTTWVPDGKHRSPNRLDAFVMAAHWLGGGGGLSFRSL